MFRIWKERRIFDNAFLRELELLIGEGERGGKGVGTVIRSLPYPLRAVQTEADGRASDRVQDFPAGGRSDGAEEV